MSERQPRKSRLSPSPLPLAFLIILITVLALGALYFVTIGMTAPTPVQIGATVKATATTDGDTVQEPEYNLTPTRVLAVPTDAPLPPGFETVPPPPEPTQITYKPGPTASLQELAPLIEWKEYKNEYQGFTIKYPPNWYLKAGATGQMTQIFSYDYKDPALTAHKGSPLDLAKVEIGVSQVQQFLADENLSNWVSRTGRVSEGDKVLREEEITVSGLPALRQLVDYEYGGLIEVVYVKRGNTVIMIVQYYKEDWSVPNRVFELLVQSFAFDN